MKRNRVKHLTAAAAFAVATISAVAVPAAAQAAPAHAAIVHPFCGPDLHFPCKI